MSATEIELEREKSAKITALAARGAAAAPELGLDPDDARRFLSHYFRHVDPVDLDARDAADLLSLVASHYQLARMRPPSRAVLAVRGPGEAGDWAAGGATVVQVVTDDRPFLVDSVTMEVLRQGFSIREVFHPQFRVRRDLAGTLLGLADSDATDPLVAAESWMHLEILPPPGSEPTRDVRDHLARGLTEVLRLVEDAVQDWGKMTERAEETIAALVDRRSLDGHVDEAGPAAELLRWLVADHFTFLGYREYQVSGSGPTATFTPVPTTGLGILRSDVDPPEVFHARPLAGAPSPLMVITKDNQLSRVHRSTYLDYLGFRTYGTDGQVTGERRFLGLFASTAYSEAVPRVPVLRQKAAEVLRRSGYDANSHGGKAILDVLETYPRDELFQASVDELAPIVERVAHLKERRQVRLFRRRDPYGRYVACLVFLPRDRYTTAVRLRMQEILLAALGGASISYTARVTESVLARLHFVVRMPPGQAAGDVDVRGIERELNLATRTWDDEYADLVASADAPETAAPLEHLAVGIAALPQSYKEDNSPRQALQDLDALSTVDEAGMALALYAPDRPGDAAHLRLKIFRRAPLSLSEVLPHLSLLGVDVIDERPYALRLGGDRRAYVYDFGLRVPGGREALSRQWTATAREQFMAAFTASYTGQSEPDGFQALTMAAGLTWRQVSVLRAIGHYLRQLGSTYSPSYLAAALTSNVDLARQLVALFETKFDPRRPLDPQARAARTADLVGQITAALNDVASLDHDRIVRSYLAVLQACVRTNAFQPDRPTLALKLLPTKIPEAPEPRPAYEIFVYAPRVEGVHLRFGAVARGGLRWSDRAEDFRTEILGLVKAQMVKNTVIVPVGAKGGFYPKRLPDVGDREAWLAEGVACYRLFVASLLDVTDNLVGGQVVVPPDVVRYDGDDPYLVVAADKGTAALSDVANAISVDAGFWLGDAFASGGSSGYDHKAMGITARGAWESVRRHFRELDIDPQSEAFTCVGIGDMSGDVFGNGMRQSRCLRLVAAFDHRHVFVDPDPDPETGFAERERLFALPRSSWADYDRALISSGGGVFPRTLKSVPITPEMRTALGLPDSATALSPAELISACLKAPVDLLWNGGIGTYVKASTESHADAGDKANDVVRVDGSELRARCVGEGGNLGFTQRGRIEYAACGGRINTDFVDNSAGVDTSDHEVNIKILLEPEVRAGRLSPAARNDLLASMTDEVAAHVLGHNVEANLALANAVIQAPAMAQVHEDWMERLVDRGLLDRELEQLPSTEEMELRRASRRGLTAPELATLLAYTKIVLKQDVARTDLPDADYLRDRLVTYFPTPLRERYARAMGEHRLHREIVTTVVVNDFVNSAGITCFHRLSQETSAPAAEIISAHVAARAIFAATEMDRTIAALDHRVDAATQTRLRLEVRTLIERATRWLVNNRHRPLDIAAAVTALTEGVRAVQGRLPELLVGRERAAYDDRRADYLAAGVPADLAAAVATLPPAYAALPVVATAARDGRPVEEVARIHFLLGQHLGLDRLLGRILELPREDRWQTMARAALRDDLHTVHAQLTAQVLPVAGRPAEEAVRDWAAATPALGDAVRTLRSVCGGRPDLARAAVGLRVVRGLLPSAD